MKKIELIIIITLTIIAFYVGFRQNQEKNIKQTPYWEQCEKHGGTFVDGWGTGYCDFK